MDGADTIRGTLIASLKHRFGNVIDFGSSTFDSKYIVATIVDPAAACVLCEEESQLFAVIKDAVCYFEFQIFIEFLAF